MKKIFILLFVLLIFPTILFAESYFLGCKEGTISYNGDSGANSKNFKKGDLFEVRNAYELNSKRAACWSDSGALQCPLMVHYGNIIYQGGAGIKPITGSVDLEMGCFFESDASIPIKDNSNANTENFFKILNRVTNGRIDEYFNKSLDKEFVDVICSKHSAKFNVAGITFTDIEKFKSEEIEKARLNKEAKNKRIQQENKAQEESDRLARQEQQKKWREERENLEAELKKFKAEGYVTGHELLANPFKYEGSIIAVPLIFIRMLERSVGIFGVGQTGRPTEDIIVSKLPVNLFGDNSLLPDYTLLIVKVKGTTEVSNRFGAKFKTPHLEYVAKVVSKWR